MTTSWPAIFFVGLLVAAASGCLKPRVHDLNPAAAAKGPSSPATPFIASVGVKQIRGVASRDRRLARTHGSGEVASLLRNDRVFETVEEPYLDGGDADFVLETRVKERWGSTGFLNFITWFPGPIIFMPNWRGNRFLVEITAQMDLIDTATGERTAYEASTHHEMVHRSANPIGHLLGAAIIVPGVVRGIRSISPKGPYRQVIYAEAYPKLWKRLVAMLVADLEPRYTAREEEMKTRCGARFESPPQVGGSWPDFQTCQLRRFEEVGRRQTEEGSATIYLRDDGKTRVLVILDEIVGWELVRE